MTRRRRGAFVVLVGPDGVGKTTVAACLAGRLPGAVRYFHFRPPVGRWADPEPGFVIPARRPPAPTWPPLGWVRLVVGVARLWIGHLTMVAPALRRGELVVGDRWAYGYLASPRDLRFAGPEWLARTALRLLPEPDLVVNLTADPDEIVRRKGELDFEEVREQLDTWKRIPARRLSTVEAVATPDAVAATILDRLGSVRDG